MSGTPTQPCWTCNGKGYVLVYHMPAGPQQRETCPTCGGRGTMPK